MEGNNHLSNFLLVSAKNFQVEWYNRCLDALNNIERQYQGKDMADIIQSKVLQVLSLFFVQNHEF